MKRALAALVLFAPALQAHIGSPDVFFEGRAGAYPVSVVIRPPSVIPGIAEVEIRSEHPGIRSVTVVPYPLVGVASKLPPTPDLARRSASDPHLYLSSVWLMAFGSYQVRLDIDGVDGGGTLSVPVPALARETKEMQRGLGWVLAALMILITVGAISIAGAAAREATLPEGQAPSAGRVRQSRFAMLGATAGVIGVLVLGNWWWGAEANGYREHIYRAPTMEASVVGSTLNLQLQATARGYRFLPDHGHLMHLFLVRVPQMDRMWHLHPDLVGNGLFRLSLPSLPAGKYKLFADVVRASGLAETPAAELDFAQPLEGRNLSGDDASGSAPPLTQFVSQNTTAPLRDGYRMVLLSASGPFPARQMQHFSFEVRDSKGQAATDLEPYMGMPGHAEFLSADSTVFAHVHPSGTVPMAALQLTKNAMDQAMQGHMSGGGMSHGTIHISPQLSFPYGFPKPGRYRMFIQIQRAGQPETASFDFSVT